MAQDLVALLILMAITCSGFFVAFTLSFGQQQFGGPAGTIYALFQIVMGFTPAAWAVWDQYNILGQSLLVIFMIICHFLVVTILITVLTNSFMAIVREANEEHQFLFAVNTISMVSLDLHRICWQYHLHLLGQIRCAIQLYRSDQSDRLAFQSSEIRYAFSSIYQVQPHHNQSHTCAYSTSHIHLRKAPPG